jgi:hypothetical protein
VFHRVSYKSFRRTRNITELGLFYNEVGGIYDIVVIFDLVVFLGGVCFRVGLLFYSFSIHILV